MSGWYISLAKASHQDNSCDLSPTNTQLPKPGFSKESHRNTVTRSGQHATLESFLLAETSHHNAATKLLPAHTARRPPSRLSEPPYTATKLPSRQSEPPKLPSRQSEPPKHWDITLTLRPSRHMSCSEAPRLRSSVRHPNTAFKRKLQCCPMNNPMAYV